MITTIFLTVSILAVISGGLISAFSARKPTRYSAWVSAYLVLVVGIIQLGLVTSWHKLGSPDSNLFLAAALIYNLGNISVITGTVLKTRIKHYPVLVNLGGLFIAIAMCLLLFTVRHETASISLAEFLVLVIIILVSMPIGLILSSKRSKD